MFSKLTPGGLLGKMTLWKVWCTPLIRWSTLTFTPSRIPKCMSAGRTLEGFIGRRSSPKRRTIETLLPVVGCLKQTAVAE